MEEIFAYAKTNFTKTVHNNVYPTISPSRPELSQAGKTILITGGGDNLGLSIAHAFVEAGAKTVIITGRRPDVLEAAKNQLEEKIRNANSQTTVVAAAFDIIDKKQIDELWVDLRQKDITVDVLISNAAKPPQPTKILDDVDDIWSQVETNARGPLYMIKHLTAQAGNEQKASALQKRMF
jgi:NAD(P)-dependent dehydrogenase (short-subunit alcohol dehydrogenase family)